MQTPHTTKLSVAVPSVHVNLLKINRIRLEMSVSDDTNHGMTTNFVNKFICVCTAWGYG